MLTSSIPSIGEEHKNLGIKRWFDMMKYFGVLQNLRCQYEIGTMIGKGNFAKVFEAIN